MKNLPRDILAIAFDFDGTLVDTLHLHYKAYQQVFSEMDIELTSQDFFSNIGGKATEAIPLFLRGRDTPLSIKQIHDRKKQVIVGMFQTAEITILPTASLLPLFHGKLPLALVSSGSRHGIELLLDRLAWKPYFEVIVTGEDTAKSKPDPAPYLLAASTLGVDPACFAAFEDTTAGLDSARRAGMVAFDVSINQVDPHSV